MKLIKHLKNKIIKNPLMYTCIFNMHDCPLINAIKDSTCVPSSSINPIAEIRNKLFKYNLQYNTRIVYYALFKK